MSHDFECATHGVAVSGAPAYEETDAFVDQFIADHETLHAEEQRAAAAAARWSVRRDDEGWWVAKRGEFTAACFTRDQALRVVDLDTLRQLAGNEWTISIYPERITLHETASPWTRQFPGTTAIRQAIAFLRSVHAARELRAARDNARALADIAIDTATHLDAALAKAVGA